MVGKTIFFTIIFFIFASCAAKDTATVNQKSFGDETLKLARNGQYTLGCNDAKYMADIFSADNFTVIAFTTKLAMDYINNKDISGQDKKRLDNYAKLLDTLTAKLEKQFKNDPRAMDLIMKRIFNTHVNHMMEGAIAAYLGMASAKDFFEFTDITYCGAKPSAGYKSPVGIGNDSLRKALMEKFEGLPVKNGKPATKPGR